jgi:hypothetical protein
MEVGSISRMTSFDADATWIRSPSLTMLWGRLNLADAPGPSWKQQVSSMSAIVSTG